MSTKITFRCRVCNEEFGVAYDFEPETTCPHCGTRYQVDYDSDFEDPAFDGDWELGVSLGEVIE